MCKRARAFLNIGERLTLYKGSITTPLDSYSHSTTRVMHESGRPSRLSALPLPIHLPRGLPREQRIGTTYMQYTKKNEIYEFPRPTDETNFQSLPVDRLKKLKKKCIYCNYLPGTRYQVTCDKVSMKIEVRKK